uniref:Uncharacterized protein n=1 Tax=Cannabis sativa TaxID=3483 RepID=A0A803P1H2_CANSA
MISARKVLMAQPAYVTKIIPKTDRFIRRPISIAATAARRCGLGSSVSNFLVGCRVVAQPSLSMEFLAFLMSQSTALLGPGQSPTGLGRREMDVTGCRRKEDR